VSQRSDSRPPANLENRLRAGNIARHVGRVFFFGVLMFGACGGNAEQARAQSWAEKMFTVRDHDFRTVGRGTKAEYHFELKNIYQEDVHIAAVRTSCGCTTPSLTRDTLATHETGAVVATFNTNSFIGQKSATVTVVFDRPYYAEVQLKVAGYIRTDITFDPPEVDFGELMPGESATQTVTITKTGSPNWRINDVRSHCSDLGASLASPEIGAGFVRYRMTVRAKESLAEGDLREQLTLISNDRSFPTTEMSVVGRVRPTLSVSPAAVSIGTISSDSAVEKKLVVRGQDPFRIKEVVCEDERFEFAPSDSKKKIHFLTLKFQGDGETGRVAQRVTIKTDLGSGKTTSFLVTGTIQ